MSPPERVVLLLLADQADAAGNVSRLSHATIRARCGFSFTSRHTQKLIRSLMEKQFITGRVARAGAYGNQVSNSYTLDLLRVHPPDAAGHFLLHHSLDTLKGAADSERQAARIETHTEGATAYYQAEDQLLVVWVTNKYARHFLFGHLGDMLAAVKKASPKWPVKRIELLSLDLAAE